MSQETCDRLGLCRWCLAKRGPWSPFCSDRDCFAQLIDASPEAKEEYYARMRAPDWEEPTGNGALASRYAIHEVPK